MAHPVRQSAVRSEVATGHVVANIPQERADEMGLRQENSTSEQAEISYTEHSNFYNETFEGNESPSIPSVQPREAVNESSLLEAQGRYTDSGTTFD